MLIYWLLPKITAQREKCHFHFVYKINGLHYQFWQAIRGLYENNE